MAAGLEMAGGTDGRAGKEFPQPHERALGVYSSWNDLRAHAILFPAFEASSVPTAPAPSPGKLFRSCHYLK